VIIIYNYYYSSKLSPIIYLTFSTGDRRWNHKIALICNTIKRGYEVKNNCWLFERLFKVKKNGVSLLGISFFVLEKFTFWYSANEESDDVIGGSI